MTYIEFGECSFGALAPCQLVEEDQVVCSIVQWFALNTLYTDIRR